ncbi:hypothetical protein [Rhodococcus sp. KRD162]|uniref:Rv0361 family membrane protein n=1 Tax=Rhodococcus sp. KRD162 TaxID=2729725 RepID=UPI0019D2A2F0|nr:hypothetical protein [Rhodococcus sp. KRD162]
MPDEKNNAPPEVESTTAPESSAEVESTTAPESDPAENVPTEKSSATADENSVSADENSVSADENSVSADEESVSKTAKPTPAAEPRTDEPEQVEPKQDRPQKVVPKKVGPQRIGPAPARTEQPSHKKWWAALVAAVVVIAAVAAGAYLLLDRSSVDDSPEAQIRSTVESFTRALASGDLATLRSSSCGDLAAFYRDIPDAEFADVHRVTQEQGSIPTLDSIDAIQVADDGTAIAQVITHTEDNPNDRSPRTFDLRLEDDQWKVCS